MIQHPVRRIQTGRFKSHIIFRCHPSSSKPAFFDVTVGTVGTFTEWNRTYYDLAFGPSCHPNLINTSCRGRDTVFTFLETQDDIEMDLRKTAKSLLPINCVRSIFDMKRAYIFQHAMRKFIRDPESSIAPGSSVLAQLVYGWGNESWSADTEYLASCIREALKSRGPILECGSGLTTLILAAITQQTGVALWSLEHQREWSERVTESIRRFRIAPPNIHSRPLRDYGEFSWYDPPMEKLPAQFSLVVCDGPPSATHGGRYGLVPILGHLLDTGCVILLDDAERLQERTIADQWSVELNTQYEIFGLAKPYIQIRIGTKQATAAGSNRPGPGLHPGYEYPTRHCDFQ